VIEDEESGDKPRKVAWNQNSPRFATSVSSPKQKNKKFHQKKKSLPIEKDKGWHFKKKLNSKHNRTVSCGAEGNILFSIGNPEKPLDRNKRRSFGVKKKSNSCTILWKTYFCLDSEGFRGF
jgi:hypothetical protein